MAIGGLGLASLAGYSAGFQSLVLGSDSPLAAYVPLFLGLFALYVLAVGLLVRRPSSDRGLLILILGFGLLFRLAVLPTPVVLSSDLYRYFWDGRVQWAGVNPYRYPPAAEELRPLRDPEVFPALNRPTKRTVYPPGAEALFAAVAALAPDSLVAWRVLLLGGEIATAALLLGLLARTGAPPTAVLLYAWAPLAVFEGVQAVHLEALLLPLLLLALRFRQEGRMARAGLALGAAVLLKLYPLILVLAWRRRGDRRFPLALALTVAAGYLCYLPGAGPTIVGFLPEYFGSAEDFNIGLRFFLTDAIGLGGEIARGTVMLLLFAVLLAILIRIPRGRAEDAESVLGAGMTAVAAYLVLVPTAMHAWYALWILPFLTLRPSPGWIWFSGAVGLSYLKYAWEPEGFPLWARALEFIPLYGLLAWEAYRRRGVAATAAYRPASQAGVGPTLDRTGA
ncbi:MAG: DUF2029 domain-containing protein [Candidatus Rokubacteria bacterium]|nr:DUF2029 domain-containing protein [Candidatus Rokubacteria bacterium]